MKALSKLAAAGAVVFVLLQFVRPGIPSKPAAAELQAPPEIRHILEKSCYDCHSDRRHLAWFDEIVPAYWLVRQDVLMARQRLNFSTLGSMPATAQKATLYKAVNFIQLGAMPLPRFLALHPDAKVTPEELAALKAYLGPWTSLPKPADPSSLNGNAEAVSLTAIPPEFNGFPFASDFESWQPISTTDRGDNSTFRFVLGNDIAVKAAREGRVSPWPDGTRFAKIAWAQELGPDGLVHPGKFWQVEFMLKDARLYKHTEGWNWGRWLGPELKPYGKNADFVNECTGCHLPVGGDDFVYTPPITTAKADKNEEVNNLAASLPATLPYQPLGWNAITMYVDPKTHSTATLFGNEAAVAAVRARRAASPSDHKDLVYPAGAVLALVTWAQREDPHWFGGRIPAEPRSVEFVDVGAASYRRFAGTALGEDRVDTAETAQRTRFVLSLAPAWLP